MGRLCSVALLHNAAGLEVRPLVVECLEFCVYNGTSWVVARRCWTPGAIRAAIGGPGVLGKWLLLSVPLKFVNEVFDELLSGADELALRI